MGSGVRTNCEFNRNLPQRILEVWLAIVAKGDIMHPWMIVVAVWIVGMVVTCVFMYGAGEREEG
jgi:hypothetical protein